MGGGQPSLSGPTGSPPPFRLPNYSPSTGPLPLSEDPVQPHGQVVPLEKACGCLICGTALPRFLCSDPMAGRF